MDTVTEQTTVKVKGLQINPGPRDCPHCGSPPEEHRVEDYDMMWGDGVVMCNVCDKMVRLYDTG